MHDHDGCLFCTALARYRRTKGYDMTQARDDALTAMDAYAADEVSKQAMRDAQIIDTVTAERDALQARLDAQAPAPSDTTWGMAVGPTSGSRTDDLNNFKVLMAKHPNLALEVRRSYTPGTKTTYIEQLPGEGVLPFFSQKPDLTQMASGALDSWAATFARSCPDGAYLTIQHEPENPSKGISAASFTKGFDRWAKVTKEANPKVKVGPCYMEWQMRVNPTYAYHKVDASLIDFWSFDVYHTPGATAQGFKADDTVKTLCEFKAMPMLNAVRSGLPFIVAEIGVVANKGIADRAKWVSDGIAWGKTANVSLLYYQVAEWYLSDTELDAVKP